jgi:release factor glutamine methyltransferase
MADEPWTIRRLLDWTENYLRGKGSESPRLETQILLAHALSCRRIDLYTRTEEEPGEKQRAAFRGLIQRRAEGAPVAYLVGQREFYSLAFEVTPAVLIPRPETELLVMECLNLIKDKPSPRVLDLGTGSGNIAVSIAHQHSTAQVTATDVSAEALAVAARNAERHGLSERIRFLHGDLFEPIPADERFDVIASNPPYVSDAELKALAPQVRDHEPRLALAAGPEGLDFYRRLISEAVHLLEARGSILVEIGANQEDAVRTIFESVAGYRVQKCFRDHTKLPRLIHATWESPSVSMVG